MVEEFFLVAQEGGAAHTEMDENALASLVEELCEQDRLDVASRLKCWAHTHPGLGLFWSRTDEETCRRLCSDWLVSIVVEANHHVRARLDLNTPVPMVIDHAPVFVRVEDNADIAADCGKEVEEKVKPSGMTLGRLHEADTLFGDEKGFVGVEVYCDRCGSWHAQGRCPMGETEYSLFDDGGMEQMGCPTGLDEGSWGQEGRGRGG